MKIVQPLAVALACLAAAAACGSSGGPVIDDGGPTGDVSNDGAHGDAGDDARAVAATCTGIGVSCFGGPFCAYDPAVATCACGRTCAAG